MPKTRTQFRVNARYRDGGSIRRYLATRVQAEQTARHQARTNAPNVREVTVCERGPGKRWRLIYSCYFRTSDRQLVQDAR